MVSKKKTEEVAARLQGKEWVAEYRVTVYVKTEPYAAPDLEEAWDRHRVSFAEIDESEIEWDWEGSEIVCVENIVTGETNTGGISKYESFIQTEAALITSSQVVQRVADDLIDQNLLALVYTLPVIVDL